MYKKKTLTRKTSEILTMVLVPTAAFASVGGAIYYVVKNTRSIQKEFWSIEKFKKTASEIKIQSEVISPTEAERIYEEFQVKKSLYEERMKEFYKQHPEFKNNELPISKKNKLLKEIPDQFDAHEFITKYVNNYLDFNKTKFLKFKFVDLKQNPKNSQELEIYFEVFLNYDYANGSYESSKIKSTPKSKYYYRSSQNVKFLSNELKIYQGSTFFNEWLVNKKTIINIIKKYDDKNKKIEEKIINQNLSLNSLLEKDKKTRYDLNEIEKIKKEIDFLNNKKSKIFKDEIFQKEVFDWFTLVIDKTNAYPDIFPKDKYRIIPIMNEGQYVSWNSRKRLNELKIEFKFENIENPKIVSDGKLKIFTLEEI